MTNKQIPLIRKKDHMLETMERDIVIDNLFIENRYNPERVINNWNEFERSFLKQVYDSFCIQNTIDIQE